MFRDQNFKCIFQPQLYSIASPRYLDI